MTKEEEMKAFGGPKRILFPNKYRRGLKGVAMAEVMQCREEHPDWLLHEVLSDIIKGANPDMPPAFLLEFVRHIIFFWEAIEAEKVGKQAPELAFA